MKNILIVTLAFFLLLAPVFKTEAQSPGVFDTTGFPQWAKDLRRWNIVLFGSFPFAMFNATLFMDLHRWNEFNGMSFDDLSRAPWPLKSGNPEPMTNREFQTTVLIAAGLSVGVAFADMLIVNIRRNRERRRIESLPTGTITVSRMPYGIEAEEDITEEVATNEYTPEPDLEAE